MTHCTHKERRDRKAYELSDVAMDRQAGDPYQGCTAPQRAVCVLVGRLAVLTPRTGPPAHEVPEPEHPASIETAHHGHELTAQRLGVLVWHGLVSVGDGDGRCGATHLEYLHSGSAGRPIPPLHEDSAQRCILLSLQDGYQNASDKWA
jgi:hypothetical protein